MNIDELIRRLEEIRRAFGSEIKVEARDLFGLKSQLIALYLDQDKDKETTIVITGY